MLNFGEPVGEGEAGGDCVANRPSDGYERPVPLALALVSSPVPVPVAAPAAAQAPVQPSAPTKQTATLV